MNKAHLFRHAKHALEDFNHLRRDRSNEELWHSLSHHLRHIVWRAGLENGWRPTVRRRTPSSVRVIR